MSQHPEEHLFQHDQPAPDEITQPGHRPLPLEELEPPGETTAQMLVDAHKNYEAWLDKKNSARAPSPELVNLEYQSIENEWQRLRLKMSLENFIFLRMIDIFPDQNEEGLILKITKEELEARRHALRRFIEKQKNIANVKEEKRAA